MMTTAPARIVPALGIALAVWTGELRAQRAPNAGLSFDEAQARLRQVSDALAAAGANVRSQAALSRGTRNLREAVVNAVRHAEAKHIEIHMEFGATNLRLDVCDDGRGFTLHDAEAARRNGHFGLSGARERATRMGGTCDVRARPGGGTIVTLELPVAERAGR